MTGLRFLVDTIIKELLQVMVKYNIWSLLWKITVKFVTLNNYLELSYKDQY